MKLGRNIVGVLLLLIGLVWLGQGVGLIQGSFMTGEAQWALIGIVCIVIWRRAAVFDQLAARAGLSVG